MNEQAIYKEQELKDGHILQIFRDTWAHSPRSWSNLGTMAIFHKRYNFGDEVTFSLEDLGSWSKMEEHIKNNLNAALCIPIYINDDTGITIKTEAFTNLFDSGQVGFIYVQKDKVREKYKKHKIKEDLIKTVTQVLETEVKTMDTYLKGEIYGFHLIKRVDGKDEIINSYSGFYGDNIKENGMIDHLPVGMIPEDLIL